MLSLALKICYRTGIEREFIPCYDPLESTYSSVPPNGPCSQRREKSGVRKGNIFEQVIQSTDGHPPSSTGPESYQLIENQQIGVHLGAWIHIRPPPKKSLRKKMASRPTEAGAKCRFLVAACFFSDRICLLEASRGVIPLREDILTYH